MTAPINTNELTKNNFNNKPFQRMHERSRFLEDAPLPASVSLGLAARETALEGFFCDITPINQMSAPYNAANEAKTK
jgi:hypothetical protein